MSDYVNWFVNDGQKNFESFLSELNNRGPVRCLQIGAYTGDASVWLYNNILKSSDSVLVDVDTWEGSEEPVHYEMNWHTVESLYDAKTAAGKADRKIIKYKGTSDNFFKNNREMYDFIYIDGDHTAYGVLKDAVAAYECLNVGGILAFDDYQWSAGLGELKEPRIAIDTFYTVYRDRLKEIHRAYQIWFKKEL
jgi:predicted O-methyltransferase YrrM